MQRSSRTTRLTISEASGQTGAVLLILCGLWTPTSESPGKFGFSVSGGWSRQLQVYEGLSGAGGF